MTTTSDGTGQKWRYNGHDPETLKTAEKLFTWGIDWLWYEDKSKNPNTRGAGWEKLPSPTLGEAERIFRSGPHTICAHLRRRLSDGDLDWIEMVRAVQRAPERWRLPPTMMWGRDGKPRSHLMYVAAEPHKPVTWKDPAIKGKGCKLAEFRVSGQTVAPGSRHADTGEPIRWEPDGCRPPVVVDPRDIVAKLNRHAAVALAARHWQDGARQDTAGPLAGLLAHGGMSQDDAEEFVEWVCAVAGDDEVDKRLGYVRRTYARHDDDQSTTGGPTLVLEECFTEAQIRLLRKWLGLGAESTTSADLLGPDLFPLTGNGDGDRFAAMWAVQVVYCAKEDAWYLWDGRRYKLDEVNEIRERAKLTVVEYRRVLGEKQAQCGRGGVASYRDCSKHAVEMDSPGAITAMLTAAKSKAEIRAAPDDLNSHPDYLNTLDGTLELDIATGHVGFHLHRPEDRLTWLAPVHYTPNATHPLFTQYERRFFSEEERWTFLGEMGGDALHGYPKRHALEFIGPHDAGKTTTLKLFAAMLGDYAASLAATNLTKNPHKGGDVGRPDLMRVKAKRLVTVAEVGPDDRLDVALFKSITSGGDAYGLRTFFDKSGGEDAVFKFALWMSGNKPYGPPPEEEAAFARLDVLDCSHVVPEDKRTPAEEAALTTEQGALDAAFAFAVRGFTRLYGAQHGVLTAPASSQTAKAKLVHDLDQWAEAIDLLFEVTGEPGDRVLKTSAWDYARTVRDIVRNSYKLQNQFEDALQRRGAVLAHAETGERYWRGVRWSKYAVEHYRVGEFPA
jgi:phage/plasmid-associated DNA primase